MTLGLIATAFALGLRHGVDFDHIAAIADLNSASENRRRGFVLSLWYALGHAVVVLALGVALIAFEATIPESLDAWMGRVVGATLLLLGVWVLIDLRRQGDDFRLRSRWMLVLGGTFAGLRRVRALGGRRAIEVEHDHSHEHGDELAHTEAPAHDHAHESAAVMDLSEADLRTPDLDVAEATSVNAGSQRRSWSRARHSLDDSGNTHRHSHRHTHRHTHQADLPTSIDASSSAGVAGGIGMLHGVGIESPTQIAIFVASTAAVGQAAGIGLLVAWCVGLVVANAGLAIAAGRGLLRPDHNATLYKALAVIVAVASIGLGLYYLAG